MDYIRVATLPAATSGWYTADDPAFVLNADFVISAQVRFQHMYSTGTQVLFAHWGTATADQSWLFYLSSGRLTLQTRNAGTQTARTSVLTPTAADLDALGKGTVMIGVRVTVSTGRMAAIQSTDGTTWTEFGTVGTPGAITPTTLDSSTPLGVGCRGNTGADPFLGRIYWAQIEYGSTPNAGGNTMIARFDANEWPGNTNSFTDARGRTWTAFTAPGSASMVRNRVFKGTTPIKRIYKGSTLMWDRDADVNKLKIFKGTHDGTPPYLRPYNGTAWATDIAGTSYNDTFDRADGAPGAAWDSSGWSIATNKLQRDGGGGDFARYTTSLGSPDHYAEALIYSGGEANGGGGAAYVCVDVRSSNVTGQNCYVGFFNPTGTGGFSRTWSIGKQVNGAYSDVAYADATGAAYPAQGDKIRLEVQGSELRLYHNNALKVRTTDTTHTTGNYVGVNTNPVSPATAYDNFVCGVSPPGLFELPWRFIFRMRTRGPLAAGGTAYQYIADHSGSSGDWGWYFRRQPGTALSSSQGNFRCEISTTGGSMDASLTPAALNMQATGADEWLAFTYDSWNVSNGFRSMQQYRSSNQGATYTAVGTRLDSTAVAAPFWNSTALLRIGSPNDNSTTGKYDDRIYWCEVLNGTDPNSPGSLIWRFDAADYPGFGLSYTDPRGVTWYLSDEAAIQPSGGTLAWPILV